MELVKVTSKGRVWYYNPNRIDAIQVTPEGCCIVYIGGEAIEAEEIWSVLQNTMKVNVLSPTGPTAGPSTPRIV